MKLWLDDYRPMPAATFTHWAKTAAEAIAFLETGAVEFISLDHDLCDEHYAKQEDASLEGTGYSVALWIEEAVAEGRIACPEWQIHSMNPSGRDRIRAAMISAERFQARRNQKGGSE